MRVLLVVLLAGLVVAAELPSVAIDEDLFNEPGLRTRDSLASVLADDLPSPTHHEMSHSTVHERARERLRRAAELDLYDGAGTLSPLSSARAAMAAVGAVDETFLQINREQAILIAKKALVAKQRQAIADSEVSLRQLRQLINDNKGILTRNERALRQASDHLVQLVNKYRDRLRAEVLKGGDIEVPEAIDSLPDMSKGPVAPSKSATPVAAGFTPGAAKPAPAASTPPAAPTPAAPKFQQVSAQQEAAVTGDEAAFVEAQGEEALREAHLLLEKAANVAGTPREDVRRRLARNAPSHA